MLNVMMSVVMLNVVMISVIMLNVVIPSVVVLIVIFQVERKVTNFFLQCQTIANFLFSVRI
jgi:hypothetical protein